MTALDGCQSRGVTEPQRDGGPLAVDEVLVIKDFYCQLLGETRYYRVCANLTSHRHPTVRLGKRKSNLSHDARIWEKDCFLGCKSV